jgi:hypothetical protein
LPDIVTELAKVCETLPFLPSGKRPESSQKRGNPTDFERFLLSGVYKYHIKGSQVYIFGLFFERWE